MSKLLVIEPAEAENLDTNPSIEDPTNGLADITAVGSTETRELTQARFGRASVQIVTDGVAVGEGIRKDSAPGISAQPVTGSCYLRGDGGGRLRLVDNTNGLTFTGKPFALLNEYWTRASVVGVLGALAVTDLRLFVETAERIQSVTFWVDAFQVEATGWPTSYADGDMERELPPHAGDAFFRWTGRSFNECGHCPVPWVSRSGPPRTPMRGSVPRPTSVHYTRLAGRWRRSSSRTSFRRPRACSCAT